MSTPTSSGAALTDRGVDLAGESRVRQVKDRLAGVVVWASFGLAMIPLAWILWTVFGYGIRLLTESTWWTTSQRNINATDSGGGAVHAIWGTLIEGCLLYTSRCV